jgi:hypothetical protein
MDFEQAFHAELSSITGLQGKVFPAYVPESITPPFLIYYKSLGEIIKTLDGTSQTRNGLYEVDLLAKNYSEIQQLFEAIKAKVLSFVGRTVGGSNIYVQDVTIESFIELFEDKVKLYRMNAEIRIYFKGE